MRIRLTPRVVVLLAMLVGGSVGAAPVGSAFTFQGQLQKSGASVSGTCDFQFSLWDAVSGVTLTGATQAVLSVSVSNGLFAVDLDWGADTFNGDARWLQIAVRQPAGSGAFSVLSPRQPLRPAPYSLRASVAGTVAATNVTGTLDDAQIPTNVPFLGASQSFSGINSFRGVVSATNSANSFAGNGAGLTGLAATNLTGTVADARLSANVAILGASQFFSGSNSFRGVVLATNPANTFVGNGVGLTGLAATNLTGTVADARLSTNVALRWASQSFSGSNSFRGVVSATNDDNSFAGQFNGNGSGLTNLNATQINGLSASSFWKLAGNSGTSPGTNFLGTTDNQALELKVNGDRGLRLEPNTTAPNVIGGSRSNAVTASVVGAVIGGGGAATAPNLASANYATIGGGNKNTIQSAAVGAVISGGSTNTIETNSVGSVVAGGGGNRIQAGGQFSVIGGGRTNILGTSTSFAVVGGGIANTVNASHGVIAGGRTNTIQSGADAAVIDGGAANTIAATGSFATIPGGTGASADKFGQMARANGSFVAVGDAQTSILVLRGTSSGTAYGELFLDGSGRRMTIPVNSTWAFNIVIVGRSSAGKAAGYSCRGVIENQGGSVHLVPGPDVTYETLGYDDSNLTPWVLADDGNDALLIKAKGGTGDSVRWVATVYTSEVKW